MAVNRSEGVLVTGGGGYLGAHLVPKLLDKGYRVKVLDLFYFGCVGLEKYINHPSLELIREDVFLHDGIDDLFRGIDHIIHLSGLSNDPSCDLDPNLSIRSNFLSTLSLARRAKEEGVKRFIFASSCSIYGAQADDFITEESKTGPVTLYALTKLECERELSRLSDDNFIVGLPRLATLFGYSPRMRFDLAVNIMCKRSITGEGLFVNGDGKQYRPFLHVADAANAFINLIEAEPNLVNNEVYNIGNDENNYTIADLAHEIAAFYPGTSLKYINDNVDVRSYRVSFKKYNSTFENHPKTLVPFAYKEIQEAVNNGDMKNMDDKQYYNLLVMKEIGDSAKLPNLALPKVEKSSRWSVLEESGADKENIAKQSLDTTVN